MYSAALKTRQQAVHAWNDDGPGISVALKRGEDGKVRVGRFAPLHNLVLQGRQLVKVIGVRLGCCMATFH